MMFVCPNTLVIQSLLEVWSLTVVTKKNYNIWFHKKKTITATLYATKFKSKA